MKNFLISASCFLLPLTACAFGGGQKKADLSSDKGKLGYAIGQQIGRQLKGANLDLDRDALFTSIGDALDGKESRLSPSDMQATMMKTQQAQAGKMGAEAKVNKDKGDAFLAANKSKPNIKTTASGLQYEVLKAGKGKSPKASDTVKVHYVGTLIDGTKFDSSIDRGQPAEFPLGGVIRGWTEGLQLMKTGGKTRFFVPSDLAYGEQGRPSIPPNSTLIFEVELLEITKAK